MKWSSLLKYVVLLLFKSITFFFQTIKWIEKYVDLHQEQPPISRDKNIIGPFYTWNEYAYNFRIIVFFSFFFFFDIVWIAD